jgi:hypothetical protein
MNFTVWLVVSIAVGMYALKGRERTAVGWTLLTAALYVPVWFVVDVAVQRHPSLRTDLYTDDVVSLLAGALLVAVMALIIWTLSDRSPDAARPGHVGR